MFNLQGRSTEEVKFSEVSGQKTKIYLHVNLILSSEEDHKLKKKKKVIIKIE